MNNVNIKGVVINLDKERYLKFNLNALCDIEEKYGDIQKAFGDVEKTPKMKDVRYLLYVGLKADDPELTEEKVGEIIDIASINTVAEKIGNALSLSLPQPDKTTQKKA